MIFDELRDYQKDCIEQLRQGLREGHRSQILVAPTGAGKTVIASYLLGEAYQKQSRAFFVCDRVSLVDQTSVTLDSYKVPHGVIQADHWRARPWEPIQVVSAQTLARRDLPYKPRLVVWDEAHTMYKSVLDYCADEEIKVIGLTATPFTKGMGGVFTNVVNSTTTNKLVDQNWLVPLKMYAAKEIDMAGAEIKFDGEWKDSEIEERGIKIVGDVVEEWITKTNEHFGGPAKTIVFSATVAHGEEICRAFAKRGFNFQQISYKDGNNDRRRALIEEFRKPDSSIVGLVSCEALAKGFDVTDIKVGIGARPYRKSLSGHIQQLGRVMRSHPGKEFALWLDHAGNLLRFLDDMQEVFQNGVSDLNKKEYDAKARKEKTPEEKQTMKCSACGFVHTQKICPSCGHERKGARSRVENASGQLVEINGKKTKSQDWMDDKRSIWGELCYLAYELKREDAKAEKFALAQYRNIYGEWPSQKYSPEVFVPPRPEVRSKVRSMMIAYRNAMNKRRVA
jgi:DNA repair protein RadD